LKNFSRNQKNINELRTYGGLKMSTEMIIAVSVMAVVFIVVSWIMQKNKSRKSCMKQTTSGVIVHKEVR
jgi:uncharacterized membrane protein YcaP (DUF421 family)